MAIEGVLKLAAAVLTAAEGVFKLAAGVLMAVEGVLKLVAGVLTAARGVRSLSDFDLQEATEATESGPAIGIRDIRVIRG